MIFFLAKKTLRSYFVEFLLLEGCLIIFFSIPAGNFSCLPDFLTILDISFTINRPRDVAQFGSAHGLGPWGREFESHHPE